MPSWDFERAAADKGFCAVCGCDEAGVGPLAGRVYAGAVILPEGLELSGLNDSKQVTVRPDHRSSGRLGGGLGGAPGDR